jgi:hypothetical protein
MPEQQHRCRVEPTRRSSAPDQNFRFQAITDMGRDVRSSQL